MERASINGIQLSFWSESPELDLLTLTPDLAKASSSTQLSAFASLLATGGEGRVSLGSFDLLLYNGVLLAGNPGDSGIAKKIRREHWSTVIAWLNSLSSSLRRERLGFLGEVPRETTMGVLLQQPYEEILRTCKANTELAWICDSREFWSLKASALGGELDKSLPPREAYLKLLTQKSRECYPGSEKYVWRQECVKRTAALDRRDLLEYFLGDKPEEYMLGDAIEAAAQNNRYELILSLRRRGAPLSYAAPIAQYGGLDRVKALFATRSVAEPELSIENDFVDWAAQGGQIDIVRYLLSEHPEEWFIGVADPEHAFEGAASGGYVEIMRELEPLIRGNVRPETLANSMRRAIAKERREVVDYLLSLDSELVDIGFDQAALEGKLHLLEYFYSLGARNVDEAMGSAILREPSDYPILEFLIERGADVNTALRNVAGRENLDLVKYLIGKGATDIRGALEEALQVQAQDAVEGRDPSEALQTTIDYLRGLLAA